jgi:hypothetical protein
LIPTKNKEALIAYYLGLFSIFPLLGLFMGIAAMVLGKKGMDNFKANPITKGKTHAGIGIGCGLCGFLFNALLVTITILVLTSRPAQSP